MIVITGPGRSGTSFLALLYRELGFDPGGKWNPELRAGLERQSIARVNTELAAALGTVAAPRHGPRSLRSFDHLTALSAKWLPEAPRERVNAFFHKLRYHNDTLDLMDWSKLEALVSQYSEELKGLSTEVEVVKDPRFCWTLHVWLSSGAAIDSVVLALRPLDAMVDSRVRAGMIPPEAATWAKNNFAYGIGLVMATAVEHRVPIEILRFPDFLADPRSLYERLPLPEHRTWEDFHAAFEKVHTPSLVNDRR